MLVKSNKLFYSQNINYFKTIWVSLNTFLNLRGHIGDSVSSVLPRSSVVGKRYDQTIFDVGSSLLSLKRALYYVRFVLSSNTGSEEFKSLLIVVQSPQLASRFISHYNLLDPKNINNVKVVSNWVSGSLTPHDNILNKKTIFEDDSFKSVPNTSADRRPGFVLVLGNFSEMRSVSLEANYARIANAAVVSSVFPGYEVTFPIAGNDNSSDFLFYVGSLFIKCALTSLKS